MLDGSYGILDSLTSASRFVSIEDNIAPPTKTGWLVTRAGYLVEDEPQLLRCLAGQGPQNRRDCLFSPVSGRNGQIEPLGE